MRLGFGLVIALGLGGCSASAAAGDGDYMDEDLPMGMCGATGCDTDQGGVPVGFPCGATNECSGAAVCVAPFVEGEVGEFTCSAQCVPLDDEASWCLDASACCDANAICNPRGLCIAGPEPVADDTAGTTDATATGGSDSGGSDTGDAGTDGSGSDSGSSSGGAQ